MGAFGHASRKENRAPECPHTRAMAVCDKRSRHCPGVVARWPLARRCRGEWSDQSVRRGDWTAYYCPGRSPSGHHVSLLAPWQHVPGQRRTGRSGPTLGCGHWLRATRPGGWQHVGRARGVESHGGPAGHGGWPHATTVACYWTPAAAVSRACQHHCGSAMGPPAPCRCVVLPLSSPARRMAR